MKTVNIIGSNVAVTTYAKVVDQVSEWALKHDRHYAVEAANTHTLSLARADDRFGKALGSFDLICPDGMPLVWTINQSVPSEDKLNDRVYGPTLMLKTVEATAGKSSFKHFLLGGKESTLEKLEKNLTARFPGLELAGTYSPPFGEWPEGENEKMAEMIKNSGANFVWVGLGCPKQEQWIAEHRHLLPPAVYFGVGAAFAFHAGEVSQAPAFIQKNGLEWLYRLCAEPRRLWRRYLVNNSRFLYYLFMDARRDG